MAGPSSTSSRISSGSPWSSPTSSTRSESTINTSARKGMTMQVTAAVARVPQQPLTIEALELDDLRPNEVLVRMVASGVCHTDAIVRDQVYPTPLPAVLGH